MQPRGALGWSVAAGAALVAGLGLRLLLGGGGVGDRSAMVMAVLLSGGAWLAAMLLCPPRTAFVVTLAAIALLDVAALPARNAPEYDAREAFFRTDQVISARVTNPPDGLGAQAQPSLLLLVEPVFPADALQPAFGLAGYVGNAPLVWDCAFQRGLQRLALSLPPVAPAAELLDIQLHLTGSPSRETDYLLVYASALRGGFIASLGAANNAPGTAKCALQS
ncbi:MAG: hypothetical protein ACR2IK_02330 [Chloroflexota bacterium]